MSGQTRPLEAVFVLSSISLAVSTLGWIFYIPAPWAIATIIYHAVIGLAHLKSLSVGVSENQTESRLVAAVAYVHDVWMNIWRSVVAVNAVRLEDDEPSRQEEREMSSGTEPHRQEPRVRLHPTATLTSIVVACFLGVAWLVLLGLVIFYAVVGSYHPFWLDVRVWIRLIGILMEAVVLFAIARVSKRMRNHFFARVEIEGVVKAAV